MKKPTKKQITAASLTGLAAVLIIWTVWENLTVGVTNVTITSEELPEAFDGFTIAQVSDLHNSHLTNETLDLLREISPDLIAVTGDVVDSNRTDLQPARVFFSEAGRIAPMYYVTGNHEAWISVETYAELEESIRKGCEVLHDEKDCIERNDAEIAILGVDDPSFMTDAAYMDVPERDAVSSLLTAKELQTLAGDVQFTVLLSHRPEFFENYAQAGMDVVLTGHTHGGQVRLPLIGGIAAPDQGFFPKYDAGVFTNGNTHMIVSRGIGNSIIPIRFNNRPELVLVTLKRK